MLLVFLLLFSSVFTEKKCLTPTELFNLLILDLSSSPISSSNDDDQLGSTSTSVASQNLPRIEMPLANAQMLQQWVGQVAQQIVIEDDTFAGNYSCVAKKDMEKASLPVGLPKKQLKENALSLGEKFQKLGKQKSDFLKMLFAFAALLSAEIGQQSFRESSFTRIFLKAYKCVADKKLIGNEKDFLPFSIVSKIKGPIDELNIEKILLEMQSEKETKSGLADGRVQIHKDFALLSALNIEMTAGDVLEFASFVHYALLKTFIGGRGMSSGYNDYLLQKMHSTNLNTFKEGFLAENGLTIENIGQDPVKYRRIAYQLIIRLRNWDQNDLKEISEERYYKIELTMREKCVFGIFTRNLMRRMANYELLHQYFGEIKSAGLPGIVQMEQEFFEKLSEQNCKISKNGLTDEQMEDERIYLHLDEAIQIEWNIWKAQLFNLLFSFAVRLEAIVHGKKEDGTIEEEKENAEKEDGTIEEEKENAEKEDGTIEEEKENAEKEDGTIEEEKAEKAGGEKIQTFFSVLSKFNLPEWANNFRKIYDAIDSFRHSSSQLAIPEIAQNLVDQISREYPIKRNQNGGYSHYGVFFRSCEFVTLFQNISKKLMKMMAKKGIDPQKHFAWWDQTSQELVAEKDFPNFCEKLKKDEKAKIVLLNNVRYDLVMQFEFNRSKDIHNRTVDLLVEWVKEKLSEESTYSEENSETMITKINCFTGKTNKEKIAKIESLKEVEKDGFEIGNKFDELEELGREKIDGTKKELEKAKKELEELKLEKEKNEYEKERIIRKLEDKKEKMKNESEKEKELKKEIEKLEKNRKKPSQFTKEFLDWVKEGKMTEKVEKIVKIWQIKKKMENAKKKMEKEIEELEKELGKKGIMEKAKEKAKNFVKNAKEKMKGQLEENEEDEERKEMEMKKEELKNKQNLKKKWEKIYGKAENLWKTIKEIEKNCGKKIEEKEEKEMPEKEEMVEQYEKEISKISKELGDDLENIWTECKIQKSKKKLKETEKKKNEIEKEITKLEEEIKQKVPKIEKQREIDEKKRNIDSLESQLKEQTEKARKLAQSFGKMLEEQKKHYEEKKEERSIN
ncbi:hypothetical protein niasHT_027097 [Heterodera trifolii]|uniref:Uncharacterized protein n=1 Tax=Heterodera trifolii TaxID=157864 RepID=A0ABD2K1S5_9BILA